MVAWSLFEFKVTQCKCYCGNFVCVKAVVLITGSEIVQTLATPSAILDVHFLQQEGADSIFGVATSTGSMGIYQLDQESADDVPEMMLLQTIQYFPENELITAFSWHPEQSAVGMTLSTGKVCLGKVDLENPSHLDVGLHEL
jgi:diphthamide biosynthesis protein 7